MSAWPNDYTSFEPLSEPAPRWHFAMASTKSPRLDRNRRLQETSPPHSAMQNRHGNSESHQWLGRNQGVSQVSSLASEDPLHRRELLTVSFHEDRRGVPRSREDQACRYIRRDEPVAIFAERLAGRENGYTEAMTRIAGDR